MQHSLLQEYYPADDWNRRPTLNILFDVIVLILNLEVQKNHRFTYDDFEAAIAEKCSYMSREVLFVWTTRYISCFCFLSKHSLLGSCYKNPEMEFIGYYYKTSRTQLKALLPIEHQKQLIAPAFIRSYLLNRHMLNVIVAYLIINVSVLYVTLTVTNNVQTLMPEYQL